MAFQLIDYANWERRTFFEHYLHAVRCTYSLTAEIDITVLQGELRRRGLKLYPALIHMLLTVVNRHQELRMGQDSAGRVGYWETMWPCYTVFQPESESFTSIWTEYSADFAVFHQRYQADLVAYGGVRAVAAKPDEPPNTINVSSLPWVNFSAFNLNLYTEGGYLLPIFTFGQYTARDGRLWLPLASQVHHAVCDGYHASRIYTEMQGLADGCREWLGE